MVKSVNFILNGGEMEIIEIKMYEDTFSTLLAGLWVTYHDADIYVIPTYFWLMLAYAIKPHLKEWRYDIQSLEDWIKNYLIITAKEVCTPEDIEKFQENSIYIEAVTGNVTLIATGDIIWENSTST